MAGALKTCSHGNLREQITICAAFQCNLVVKVNCLKTHVAQRPRPGTEQRRINE